MNMAYLDQRLAQLDAEFARHSVAVGNASIAYRENGTTRADAASSTLTVVALHGIGSGAASWLDVALRFSHARFIAWDAPGYGKSSPLPQQRPLASHYAAALDAFLDALQIERCVLVGHSLGALMVAACLAGAGNYRVRQAVLLSPARGYGAGATESQRVRAERLQTLEALGIDEMARLRSGRLLSEFATDDMREWVRWNMAGLNRPGYLQAVELLCGDDIGRYAPASVPVSVYCGAQDAITPPAACQEVAQKFDTRLELIDRAGHASPCEAAGAVAQAIFDSLGTNWKAEIKSHPVYSNPAYFQHLHR